MLGPRLQFAITKPPKRDRNNIFQLQNLNCAIFGNELPRERSSSCLISLKASAVQCSAVKMMLNDIFNGEKRKPFFLNVDVQSPSDSDSMSTTSNGSDSDSKDCKSGKRYACEFCPRRFNLLRTYERHILEKHRVKSYRCRICHQEFRNRQVLKQHCETNHQEERVPCHLCQKTFTTKSSLRLHHDAIHKGIRYQCDYCDKSFGQLGSLRRHVNTIHEGSPINNNVEKKVAWDANQNDEQESPEVAPALKEEVSPSNSKSFISLPSSLFGSGAGLSGLLSKLPLASSAPFTPECLKRDRVSGSAISLPINKRLKVADNSEDKFSFLDLQQQLQSPQSMVSMANDLSMITSNMGLNGTIPRNPKKESSLSRSLLEVGPSEQLAVAILVSMKA